MRCLGPSFSTSFGPSWGTDDVADPGAVPPRMHTWGNYLEAQLREQEHLAQVDEEDLGMVVASRGLEQ